jgi:glycosyltransferase involved in cell wall biosynthesis
MSSEIGAKPEIIVVALGIDPHRGSEPGKGWWWSCALSEYFRLHLVTLELSRRACKNESILEKEGWTFHTTQKEITTWDLPTGYMDYGAWLKEAMAISRQVATEFPICGLCHISLGSFRVLPRYDRLGIPYIVGPLGGGECSPLRFTWERPAPLLHKIAETLRPVINNSFALVPHLRVCLSSAEMVLATSKETERVVRKMGARETAVVFPDAFDSPIDPEKVAERRASQVDGVKKRIRLLWQGRPFWWKGPDLALLTLRRALDAGLGVDLTMVSVWDGAFGKGVWKLAEKLSLSENIQWVGHVPREKFLEMTQEHHGLLATSLHESGGIPLVEAQALGMPCITLGLGGLMASACPEAGVNETTATINEFVEKAVVCLANWQQHPDAWLDQSKKAVLFARQFTTNRLKESVLKHIVPAFKKKSQDA